MSVEQYGAEMSEEEIMAFLEHSGLGTLAFGSENGGYALPMSFGYDSARGRCVFQFAFGDGSRKQAFIEATNRVSLAVHEWNSVEDWRSVVLQGTLHRIPEDGQAKAAGLFAAHAKIASLDVFRQPLEELDLLWYELRIEKKHGRAAE